MFTRLTDRYFQMKYCMNMYFNRRLKKEEVDEVDKFLTIMEY